MRSATAPETMVAAVPQNMTWKTKKPICQGVRSERKKKAPLVPTGKLPDRPKENMKPTAPKATIDMAMSRKFFCATLMEFFERTMPASSSRKPACIKRTRPAATSIQTKSRSSFRASRVSSWAAAGEGRPTAQAARPLPKANTSRDAALVIPSPQLPSAI